MCKLTKYILKDFLFLELKLLSSGFDTEKYEIIYKTQLLW